MKNFISFIMKYSLITLLFIHLSLTTIGQVHTLPNLLTDEIIMSAALLPDSSLMIVAEKQDKSEVRRYTYQNKQWTLSPDELSATINRLSAGHKHFRFSPDFRQVLVLINEKKTERCYRIEQAGNGKWGLPVEVLKSIRGEFNHATPALSVDHTKFYVSAYGVLANNILVFDSNDQVNYHALPIDEFSRIDRVIPIGTNSFLLQAQKKSEDKTGYYLIELVDKNQYTAPLFIKELSDGIDFVPFEVSITPYPGWVLFGKFNSGQLYMVKLPAIIADAWNTRSNPSREQITQEVNPPKSTFVSPVGSYHALLIGNDDYVVDGLDLDQPGKDVKRLKEILVNAYTFDEENVHVLINASRSDIFNALYKLRESLTRADNLLIFYAGHGYWDDRVQQGYWWPVDASKENPSNWLSNSDLREQIRGLSTAHTLLISDACFSGGIFKTRGTEDLRNASADIQLLYRMPSRRAITSGTLSTVPDKSVFFRYLSKYLEENEFKYLASAELFHAVRKSVLNNSVTVPQDGVIMDSGDEGGDFIFIKR